MKVCVILPEDASAGDSTALRNLVTTGCELGFEVELCAAWESAFETRTQLALPLDAPDSVVLATEMQATRLLEVRLARRVVWWQGVDRFTRSNEVLRQTLKRSLGPLEFVFQPQLGLRHWAASAYALEYLKQQGASPEVDPNAGHPSVGHPSAGHPNGSPSALFLALGAEATAAAEHWLKQPKLDVISYEPSSMNDFLRQIMLYIPHVQWLALPSAAEDPEGSTRNELLGSVKVHVDFAEHAERSLALRQAVASGAVALSGTQGCAGNATDSPLPLGYKHDERKPGAAQHVAQQIASVINNFAVHHTQFERARRQVLLERAQFKDQVFQCLAGLEAELLQRWGLAS